jgi:ABC-2 type transport system permease protein
MKLQEIFRFEVACQSRRLSIWFYFAAVLGLTYQLTSEAYIDNARTGGYFFNAPFVIAAVTLLMTLMALLVPAAVAGEAGARDAQTRMHPLLYTAPISKAAYLGGRFLAAFFLVAMVLIAVPIGLLLAVYAPGPEPALVGPFRPAAYVAAYATFALPNAFVATALLFAMAVLSRRAVTSYLGAVLLFVMTILTWEVLAEHLGQWELAKVVDPLGLTAMSELSRAWTPVEKNSRLIGLEGALLSNRLIWVGIALGALALTYHRFRFAHHAEGARRRRRDARTPESAGAGARGAPVTVPRVRRAFGPAAHARQALAVAWESFRVIATGWGGLGLGALTVLLVLILPELMEHMGVPLVPTTGHITRYIGHRGEVIWMVIPLLVVYYAGELVWRERDAELAEIADAAPVPDWVPLVGKLAGLALMLVALQALMMAAAMLVQAMLGHHDFQIGLYLRILFGLQLADHLLFALLAVVVQVLVSHKCLAHMAAVFAYAFMVFHPALGVEHNLLVYGSDPGWSYSDMRGFEPFAGPWLWFKLYWAARALLLGVGARLLWVRGREARAGARLALARRRLTARTAGAAALAAGLVVGLGGFVFYNTNVLSDYRTAADEAERGTEYERRYGRYEGVPQPALAGTRLHVEIHPARRAVEARGTYTLVNRHAAAIDSLHLAPAPEGTLGAVRFDRAAREVLRDDALRHRIYALETPLRPGDSLRLDFAVRLAPRGFSNRGADASVAANGTYVRRQELLPAIGYQPGRELSNAGERNARGLPPRPAIRALHDAEAQQGAAGQRIAFEAVVGTDTGQIALAPGALRRTWTEGGRRYFHYVTDVPIRNDYAFFSADYAVHAGRWKDVAIEIVHHPGHAWNADRMLRSVQASLDYHTRHFGPYPHRQLRLVEHPGAGMSLHAYPVNVSYFEGFSLMNPDKDARNIDFPFAVVAHEVAHQWWGGQVMPAPVEGSPLLTESLAWYSASAVIEATHGDEHLQRFMRVMRESYLTPRARAGVPLLRGYDWFTAYRKGLFAMHALREYVGEERVNTALRRLVEKHGAGAPPLPTSLDLYRELQAVTPDSLRPLLADLFETNTFWELAAERATAEPTGAGAWRVTLDVQARKVVVDTAGVETAVPMDDLVEVGVFAAAEDGRPGEPLYLRMHRVRSGEQRITVTVPKRPARAGIDPRGLLIDIEPDDNLKEVMRGG